MKHIRAFFVALAVTAGIGTAASALDIASMKTHATPASDSLEAAQICSAMSMAYAFTYADATDEEGKARKESYTILSQMWLGIAAEKTGVEYKDYIDNTAMNDMISLADLDEETIDFYDSYCNQASRDVINAAQKKEQG